METQKFKFKTLRQFAELMPGVDARAFADKFEDPLWLFHRNSKRIGFDSFQKKKTFKGVTVKLEEFKLISDTKRVYPWAAEAFKRLYEGGALPMIKGRSPGTSDKIDAYIKEAEIGFQQEEAERLAEIAKIKQRRDYIEHPDTVPEREFRLSLLNDIFFKHKGGGSHTMMIGGLTVNKSLLGGYSSNSGKSRDWSYNYTWTSADGTKKVISRESDFQHNRRNDADRNYGLHE